MNFRRLIATCAIAVLVYTAWFHFHPHSFPSRPLPPAPASAGPVTAQPPFTPSPAPAGSPYAGEEPSHLADKLNSPGTDIRADLRLLDEVLIQYRSAVHGDDPVGDNAEVTAALTGKNSLGFAFIPRNHPAINAQGELCDRWGTPFFFHPLAGDQMEIRSAGPDRKMWTADDVVLTPGD